MINRNPFIGIAGNIGVGKTTFTEIVAEKQNWHPFYESVMDNPYLNDFYGDMQRWGFNLQIYFLHHRFRNHVKMSQLGQGVIQDRTIYEDVEIFAKNLHLMGNIDDRDWENYRNLFKVMISFLRKPDLIIYLKASTDTLLTRIKKREKKKKKSIDPEYLHTLNVSYDKWIANISDIPVLIVDTNDFNIFDDKAQLKEIIKDINKKLN